MQAMQAIAIGRDCAGTNAADARRYGRPDAADLCGRRETPILEIARSPAFTLEKLKEALARSAEIH